MVYSHIMIVFGPKKGLPYLSDNMKPVFLGMNYYNKAGQLVSNHAYILEGICYATDNNIFLKLINPHDSTKIEYFKLDDNFYKSYNPHWASIPDLSHL